MPPPYCYDYPRPAVTVDLAIFAIDDEGLRVLLIKRKLEPFAGQWALPGGFLDIDEGIEEGARRELREETGLSSSGPISFLGVYGDPGRDPRGRTISLAHAAVLSGTPPKVQGSDDAQEAAWRIARSAGVLAFDHEAILAHALSWLADEVQDGQIGLDLLPEEFGEDDIRLMHQAIFGLVKDAAPWLRRMKKEGRIEPRPARTGSIIASLPVEDGDGPPNIPRRRGPTRTDDPRGTSRHGDPARLTGYYI